MKDNFKVFIPHLIAIAVFWILAAAYYYPAYQGNRIKQSDITQYRGMSHEIRAHQEEFDENPLWQGNMFSGMPSYQTTKVEYNGNVIEYINDLLYTLMPNPIGVTFMYMLGFYLLMLCIGLNPWLSVFGALAFGFSSYFFIIIEAGHNSKALAIAYMPPVLGGIILAYRKKVILGSLITAVFLALEIYANHLQVTYYLLLTILAVGILYLIKYIKENRTLDFFKNTGFLFVALLIAILANAGNLLTTYEYSKVSTRGKSELTIHPENGQQENIAKQGLDRDYITRWSYGKEETFSFLIPDVKGPGSGAILGSEKEVERLRKEEPTFFNYVVSEYQNNQNVINTYWGDQPGTSGSVYVGAIIFLLAFLALFFVKNKLKWPLLIITILAILLAWGKNMMWFTDIFIDYFPMYNKFRAVTIILILVELAFPILAALFLHELIIRRDDFTAQEKKLYKFIGGFLLFYILLIATPTTFFSFTSENEEIQFSQQYQQGNVQQIDQNRNALIDYRIDIFRASAFKSLIYIIIAVLLIVLFIKRKIEWKTLVGVLAVLVLIDLWVNDKRYINNEKVANGNNFVSWESKEKVSMPYAADAVDNEILQREINKNSELKNVIDNQIQKEQKNKKGRLSQLEIESIAYTTLMRSTHYRVLNTNARLDADARTAYFHKTLGGYHGAKMKKYQELIDFELGKEHYMLQQAMAQGGQEMVKQYLPQMNAVNMLNARYIIGAANTPEGRRAVLVENSNAFGNAWFVNQIKIVANADSAILNLKNTDLRRVALANQNSKLDAKSYTNSANDYINLTTYLPNKLTYKYKATSEQFAVFSEIYYDKGWKAFINGTETEIYEVDFLLRGLKVPAGEGTIEMIFEPNSHKIGVTLTYISSLLIVLAIGGGIYLERKNN